ncbi:hypothetical protein VPNG_03015 [Cytospora leucostoma]|uniref:DUF7136 domain-containing protein n=1 Tax=Cytospora leucostoma TaxID=1230097 RepID=A0A423XFY9_9PEZI|nr:hypothetical protein VPNG_03015 [Cytospora leucostoma]
MITNHLILLGCFLAHAGMSAAQITFPTSVELDLVFPRDATYSPVALMPIVFAVQNSQAASSLGLTISWQFVKIGAGDPSSTGFWDLTSTNYSSDPYYIYTYTPLLKDAEGDFKLLWYAYSTNCSSSGSMDPSFRSENKYVTFTLQNGTQQPDLVAAISPDTCATMSTQTYDIVGTVPYSDYENPEPGRNSCAVLAEPSPAATPCALSLVSAQASSISAAITATACAGKYPDLTTGCPQPTKTSSANMVLRVESSVAVLGLLGILYAGILGLQL